MSVRSTPEGIPRIIHRIWLDEPMTPEIAALGRAWQELHPTWRVHTWRDWELPRLRCQEQFDAAENPAQKADIARLELLHRFGGVYVDTDFEPLRPLDGLIAATTFFAATEDGHWVATGIMGSVPCHPLLAELIDGIPGSIDANRGAPPNVQTGPKYFTEGCLGYSRENRQPPISVFPAALFYPYHFTQPDRRTEPFPDAFAVHHWSHSWKSPVEDDVRP